jgi:hypothetical protein
MMANHGAPVVSLNTVNDTLLREFVGGEVVHENVSLPMLTATAKFFWRNYQAALCG